MFYVASSREYYAKIRVKKGDISKIKSVQYAVITNGLGQQDESSLANSLNAINCGATLLGLVFVASTPIGIASAVIGIVSGLGSSGISNLEDLLNKGYIQLDQMLLFMNANPQYDMIEINLPFLEYKSTSGEVLRLCEATSSKAWAITATHTSGGWQYV